MLQNKNDVIIGKGILIMDEKSSSHQGQEELLAELEGIRDVYQLDVKQFVGFVRERKLLVVDGFRQYAKWLDAEHDGKTYSPATINRKLSAARNRVRYAFKRSAFADSLRRKYQVEDVLKSVKLRKIDKTAVPSQKVLDIAEARALVGQTKDRTIRLMVTFLVRTGVRVSEMLGIRLEDLTATGDDHVQVRVRGTSGRERVIHVKKDLIEQIKARFCGQSLLFEHQGGPYSRISVTNRIKHESLKILGREVSAQMLRHTWAAIQIKRGRGVKVVAAVLGHSDPGLTARMYSEASPGDGFLDLEEVTRNDLAKLDDDGGAQSGGQTRVLPGSGPVA
jgi:integrase